MVPLIILLLVLALVVLPLWAIVRTMSLSAKNASLERRLSHLEGELERLRHDSTSAVRPTPTARAETARPDFPAEQTQAPAIPQIVPAASLPPAVAPAPIAPLVPEPPPVLPRATPPEVMTRPAAASTPPATPVNWEQFMGAKLFAWLGGLAAFLSVAFFIKYSFEHGWISPELRATFGFLFGVALVGGGLKLSRGRYGVTAQTLIATGVVSLYAVTFACNSIYQFDVFQEHALLPFALMSLITVVAFLLAVRLEAHVIAVLGIVGGFLTPILLATGRDNPPGLFGYVALLDVGLIAVAVHRRWLYLTALGALGTLVVQFGWAEKFLSAAKAPTAMGVCLAFCALFLIAHGVAQRRIAPAPPTRLSDPRYLAWSAAAFPFAAFCFAAIFLGYDSIATRPGLLFAFVFGADVCLLALAWLDATLRRLPLCGGLAVCALLAAWTGTRLTNDLLPWALACYLLHAGLHTAFPLVLERRGPGAPSSWGSQLFPPLALLLLLGPMLKLDAVSLALWPGVLLVDLIALGAAWATASLAGVALVLVLTLAVTGLWIFRAPVAPDAGSSLLLAIGGFAMLFFGAGLFLIGRFSARFAPETGEAGAPARDARAEIPALSALLPFLLLILMAQRLPFANPSPLFGLALLLVALSIGLAAVLARPFASRLAPPATNGRRQIGVEWLPGCALAGLGALEYAWRTHHFRPENAGITLAWYLLFYAVFAAHPFVLRRRFAALTGPWAIAALAGVVQFPLVHQLVKRTWPNDFMGVLPALFAVAPLVSLFAVRRITPADGRARLNQLAWFGGVTLLFLTLVFPIQFERQWITLGWALEGVALLWLFRRVPHPALRAVGVGLLAVAFIRLALNPAVLGYHARGATPIFNWYLYSYGVVTAALFFGARLLVSSAPTDRDHRNVAKARGLLNALGTVLAFLLLNLEIADYFTPPGARRLVFQFSGDFGRDMTYTIAWALFALGLLLISLWQRVRLGRYAGQALLVVAMAKLFLHDLARLEALYRVGAFLAVAVIAILASVAYQRFQPADDRASPPPS